MNKLKRFLGIVWIIIGLAAGYYLLISQAVPKFISAQAEDRIPAIIYAFILTPLIVGSFLIFGFYALKGEYDEVD
jgi:Na+/proline symporter